ncbi:hypothetical protein R1sor_020039 [Riccia sorocarpa]|uniref:Uncharacterized protein n=1 Tax=Riccia sorocarpa TaxID=122646 RepID=A0ABD3IEE0_9MARC
MKLTELTPTRWGSAEPASDKWWNSRDDLHDVPVTTRLVYEGEKFDNSSLGASLNWSDIQGLVEVSLRNFGARSRSDYLVLTSEVVLGLILPNGDDGVRDDGIDGMTIMVVNLMAAIGTKPHRNGYFREDGAAASGGCQGVLRESDQ